jgi:hypothetical protein
MSEIDTGNNSYAGQFLGIALYHPTELIEMDEFDADEHNLLLGGGSGEHPAMKIHNLDFCVSCYLDFICDLAQKKNVEGIDDFKTYSNFMDTVKDEDVWNVHDNLDMSSSWTIKHIARFSEQIKNSFDSIGNSLNSDYASRFKELALHYSEEEKVNIMLGEFIYFCGKRLLSKVFNTVLEDVEKEMQNKDINIEPIFHPVSIDPKGYPNNFGRYTKKDPNKPKNGLTVVWGLRFDEEDVYVDKSLQRTKKKVVTKKILM